MDIKFSPLVYRMQPLLMFACVSLLVIGVGRTPRGAGASGGQPSNNGQGQRPPAPGTVAGADRRAQPPQPANRPARGGDQQQPPPADGAAQGPAISYPFGYAGAFAQYAVVDRPDNVARLIYIQPEAVAGLQSGRPLPEGTTLVIEAYNTSPGPDGRLVPGDLIPFIHVSQKIGGRWRFASFTPAGTRAPRDLPDENPRACADCHSGTRDFVFSRAQLDAFATEQVPQYVVCGKPGRDPCN